LIRTEESIVDRLRRTHWRRWNPCLLPIQTTVAEAAKSFPKTPPVNTPFVVWLFENPASPISFAGATDLDTHDLIHISLSRGLLPQDEAFVVGYSMGNARQTSAMQWMQMRNIASRFYPKFFNFSKNEICSFDLGFDAGVQVRKRNSKRSNIHRYDFGQVKHWSLRELRWELGCTRKALQPFISREMRKNAGSKEALRLRLWGKY